MIADDRLADARQTLAPLAYSPHPGDRTDGALELMQDIEDRLGGKQAGAASQPAAPAALK